MKNLSQTLKTGIMQVLEINKPSESILVADGKSREQVSFPSIVVDIIDVSNHSSALAIVKKIKLTVSILSHSGDEDEAEINSWSDQVESILNDVSLMSDSFNSSSLILYDWEYSGSDQAWDESTLEVRFSVDATCAIAP